MLILNRGGRAQKQCHSPSPLLNANREEEGLYTSYVLNVSPQNSCAEALDPDVTGGGVCVCSQSCLPLCNPMDCSLPGSSVRGILPGKNTGVGCHFFLQRIFPTHVFCTGRWILYHCATGGARKVMVFGGNSG